VLTTAERFNLALRALMELGVVSGLAYWGYHAGNTGLSRILLGVAAPLLGFGFWGLVDFRGAGAKAEFLRLFQELALSGLAAAAWFVAGQRVVGGGLAIVSIVHHALVYILKGSLLEG
jgi:hypothetical protein